MAGIETGFAEDVVLAEYLCSYTKGWLAGFALRPLMATETEAGADQGPEADSVNGKVTLENAAVAECGALCGLLADRVSSFSC